MREPIQYSDNIKMDKSGIIATIPQYGHDMQPLKGKTVTGGKIYMEAVGECDAVVTDKASLSRIAGVVEQGFSLDYAVDIVAKEVAYPEEAED